ncbi:MAG: hypothetical protein HPY62_02555 [Bacteroidales bacterium]|nr:hypothetical protein [Bacteroidales bacterium]
MRYWKAFTIFLILSAILSGSPLEGQEISPGYSRQAAYNALSAGDYEKALSEFTSLLKAYPRDPVYKYYSGLCLVKMERDPVKASVLLREAVEDDAYVKPVPVDGLFYLGRALQMSGKFSEAIKYFNLFANRAGKKKSREYNTDAYLAQCKKREGQIAEPELLASEKSAGETIKAEIPETVQKPKEETVVVPKNNGQAKEPLPSDYDKKLEEGIRYQVKADSVNNLAAAYKKNIEKLPPEQRPEARTKLKEMENDAAQYQKLANEKLNGEKPQAGTGNQQTDNSSKSGAVGNAGEIKPANTAEIRRDGIYSIFEILPQGKPIPEKEIPMDASLPSGLIYRIQMAVYTKPVTPEHFKGIRPIYGYSIPEKGMIRYYAGMFRRSAEASKALLGVKQLGFRDAFLTAVYDGKQISLERANILEKEWGMIPFEAASSAAKSSEPETLPSLLFRVEIERMQKPVKDDVFENYRKIAGTRGVEIFKTDDDKFAYLIGKFITFEDASDYAGLLVRNGYKNARVTAWIGSKEITVDSALKLFEKPE